MVLQGVMDLEGDSDDSQCLGLGCLKKKKKKEKFGACDQMLCSWSGSAKLEDVNTHLEQIACKKKKYMHVHGHTTFTVSQQFTCKILSK